MKTRLNRIILVALVLLSGPAAAYDYRGALNQWEHYQQETNRANERAQELQIERQMLDEERRQTYIMQQQIDEERRRNNYNRFNWGQ
jgi:hypothetical protein